MADRKEDDSSHLHSGSLRLLTQHINKLTSSGLPKLDEKLMKKIKTICKKGDGYVAYAFDKLQEKLRQQHSEIRLSSFQIMKELFERSHKFRELMVADMQLFLELTVETNVDSPLPPPKPAAKLLKEQTLKSMVEWNGKYGKAYKKLALGFNYLKTRKRVDFTNITSRTNVERLQEEARQERMQNVLDEKLKRLIREMEDVVPEIQKCVQEADSCFSLLFPLGADLEESFTPSTKKSTPSEETKSCAGENKCKEEDTQQADRNTKSSLSAYDTSSESEEKGFVENDSIRTKHENLENCDVVIDDSQRSSGSNINESSSGVTKYVEPDVEEFDRTGLHSSENMDVGKVVWISEHDHSQQEGEQREEQGKIITMEGAKVEEDNASIEEPLEESKDDEQTQENAIESSSMRENASVVKTEEPLEDSKGEEDQDQTSKIEGIVEEDASDVDGDETMQSHGVQSLTQSITIDVSMPTDGVDLVEDDDNTDVIRTLDDSKKLISTVYMPKIKSWIQDLNKIGNQPHRLKKCIDLKQVLHTVLDKHNNLKVQRKRPSWSQVRDSSDDEDGDDFEDVPEKEGYEPHIPDHLREEYGLDPLDIPSTSGSKPSPHQPQPSTSSSKPPTSKKSSTSISKKYTKMAAFKEKMHQFDWHPVLSFEHDPADPTSRAATIAALKKKKQALQQMLGIKPKLETQKDAPEKRPVSSEKLELQSQAHKRPATSQNEGPDSKSRKDELLAQAPVIPFGPDLEHWAQPENLKAPVIMRPQSDNRVWISHTNEEEVVLEHAKDMVKTRVMHFTGKFEPVKWKCRAPLPSGKLCERMDRYKCPFHGKIIARDEEGKPAGEQEDQLEVKQETTDGPSETSSPAAWQDPELLRDIESATGVNLAPTTSRGKGKSRQKGKGKAKKSGDPECQGLTDIRQRANTSRARLEKQIFNRTTLRRVNSVLEKIDNKRVRDKFVNQFHYALKS